MFVYNHCIDIGVDRYWPKNWTYAAQTDSHFSEPTNFYLGFVISCAIIEDDFRFFSGKYDCLDLLQILWKKMSFIWSRKRILPKSYLIVEKKLEKTQFVWTKRGSLYEGQTVLCEAQSVFIEYVDWEIIKALALPTTASPYLLYPFLFHRKQNIKTKSCLQLLYAVNPGHQNSLKS